MVLSIVEARLTPICSIPYHEARERIRHFLFNKTLLSCFYEITENERDEDEFVSTHVEKIWVGECFRRHGSGLGTRTGSVPLNQTPLRSVPEVVVIRDVELSIHVYQVHDQEPVEEYNETDHGQELESVMMAHHWTLPCEEFEGVWEKYGCRLVFLITVLPFFIPTRGKEDETTRGILKVLTPVALVSFAF